MWQTIIYLQYFKTKIGRREMLNFDYNEFKKKMYNLKRIYFLTFFFELMDILDKDRIVLKTYFIKWSV